MQQGIRSWFRGKLVFPVAAVISLLLVVQISALLLLVVQDNRYRAEISDYVSRAASKAIKEKNRDTMESLFMLLKKEMQTEGVVLCQADQYVFSFPPDFRDCSEVKDSLWLKNVNIDPEGQNSYTIRFAVPRLQFAFQFAAVAVSALAMLIVLILIQTNIIRSVHRDIIEPLMKLVSKSNPSENSQHSRIIEIQNAIDMLADTFRQMELLNQESSKNARNAAIAQMTQMLAHDVRKPFSMIHMVLGSLTRMKSISDVQKMTSIAIPEIKNSLESVNGLIQDVMEISSKSKLIMEDVDVKSLLETALMDSFRIYPEAEVSIEYKLQHSMILHIEKAKVLRIFANIIGNGLQAMRYKGHIRIETREASSSMIEFVLSNDGPHIPAEHLPKLFDAFFTSGKKGGTGLGLAIAHKVVVAHGGEIRCESAPDNGVSFIFTLPATRTKTPPNPISLPRQSSDFIKAASMMQPFDHDKSNEDELKFIEEFELCAKNFSRKIRILLVDDEQVYREGLREKLTRHLKLNAYIEISAVGTPEEALKFPSADLAIIDVDLDSQVMNGFDIVELLRKRGDTGIICTHSNRVLASDHKTAIDRGADAFLPKPMTTLHLLKLLCQAQKRLGLANRWCS